MADYNRFQTFGENNSGSYGSRNNDRLQQNLYKAQSLLEEPDQSTTTYGGFNVGFGQMNTGARVRTAPAQPNYQKSDYTGSEQEGNSDIGASNF